MSGEYDGNNINILVDYFQNEASRMVITNSKKFSALIKKLGQRARKEAAFSCTVQQLLDEAEILRITIGNQQEMEMNLGVGEFSVIFAELIENLSNDETFSSIYLRDNDENLGNDWKEHDRLFLDKDVYKERLQANVKAYFLSGSFQNKEVKCFLSKETFFNEIKRNLILSKQKTDKSGAPVSRRVEKPASLKGDYMTSFHHIVPIGCIEDGNKWNGENLVKGIAGEHRIYDPGSSFDIEAYRIAQSDTVSPIYHLLLDIYRQCCIARSSGSWQIEMDELVGMVTAGIRITGTEEDRYKNAAPVLMKLLKGIETGKDACVLGAEIEDGLKVLIIKEENAAQHFKSNLLQVIYEMCLKGRGYIDMKLIRYAIKRFEQIETENERAIPVLSKLIQNGINREVVETVMQELINLE